MLLSRIKVSLPAVFLLSFFLSIVTQEVIAQRTFYEEEEEKMSLSERLYFGGNFSLQLGRITFVDISPLVGVMITDRYSGGLGITYQYLNFKDIADGESSVYGGRIFNRYNILPNIFAHAEYETLNVRFFRENQSGGYDFEREWIPGLFLGGGYFIPFGNRGGMNFTLLYNVLYDNIKSPYNEPYVLRAGFVF